MEQMTLLRRLWAPLAAVLLFFVAALLPRVGSVMHIRVALSLGPSSEPLIKAGELGLLPSDRFQVAELPWTSAVTRSLGNGAADVGVVTLDGILRMREGGQRIRVLMALDESAGADAVMARKDISDVAGLKAKRIGFDMRGAGAYLLANALEGEGLTMADIHPVQLVQSEMRAALQAGKVDAVVVSDPWLEIMASLGLRVIYDSTQLEIPIVRLLVASERAYQSSRAGLKTLLAAQMEMSDQIRSTSSFSGETAILQRERLSAEEFVKVLARSRPVDVAANRELLAGSRPKLENVASRVEAQMRRHGLLSEPLDEAPWIDFQLLEEVVQ